MLATDCGRVTGTPPDISREADSLVSTDHLVPFGLLHVSDRREESGVWLELKCRARISTSSPFERSHPRGARYA
jgi:hypothetical protein